ncbi:unnamed protein product [Ixodes persulcatus]
MYVEASIVTSPDRMRTQSSRPLCEQHLNIVTAGIAKLDDAFPGIVVLSLSPQLRHQISRRRKRRLWKERLKEKLRFHPVNSAATKTLLGQWCCVRVFLGPTSARKLV